ncbi:hypothetical protein POTOM_041477 [Populus tomentosa]|uniref:Uncharacterized protein n=1 Tax=Populus tomentosa TaxID=118781 RepID=A0A8X8CIG3_POPTO|nr:hypothetical protein POTOM_041477 [Populus tomentosa]
MLSIKAIPQPPKFLMIDSVLILNTAIWNILRTVKTRGQCKGQIKQTGQGPLGLATQLQPIDRIKPFVHSSRKRSASIICSAAMNARCSTSGQTQTVLKETPTITKAPVRGGFFFFGFLAFLGFLKDKESEGDYRDSRRR